MFSTRYKEKYVLLESANTTLKKIFRENQFLRDVCEDAFHLEEESAPIHVTEDADVDKKYLEMQKEKLRKGKLEEEGEGGDEDANVMSEAEEAANSMDAGASAKTHIKSLLKEFSGFLSVKVTRTLPAELLMSLMVLFLIDFGNTCPLPRRRRNIYGPKS